MQEIIKGKIWKYRDDVNTDEIIPARYLNTSDEKQLAKHCMEDIDTEFVKKISKGDIIVAGKNFGCGSSREHAPICIKAAGISCVIAKTFARIFYRNCFNTCLPIFECADFVNESDEKDEIEINVNTGVIKNITQKKQYKAQPYPKFVKELLEADGLMNYIKNKI
ncbi:3-isopropylmalate dehydratase small subunit [bacterium]|nr:3-isopropylmalate dehydratase small subunit [bacterium]